MTRKNSLDDLAIFGGPPCIPAPLHVGQPNIGHRRSFYRRIRQALDARRLTNDGPLVRSFERRLAQLLKVRHCVAVCNATVGLQLTARALGLTGEVLVPSFTFVATPNALYWQGIQPVFCDVATDSLNLDPSDVEARITPRTSGIIGVHVFGRPCPTEKLAVIAKRHRLALLFDASHALGTFHLGRPIGGFGDAEVFSFHGTKMINSFEGGAVATNRSNLADKLRLMRNFGFTDIDKTGCLGINAKMHEISAAMGITSLEAIDRFVSVNNRNYNAYRTGLTSIPGIHLIEYQNDKPNYQYITVLVESRQAGLNRDELMKILAAENVYARRYFFPGCHKLAPYSSSALPSPLLNTDRLVTKVLCLPTGTGTTIKHIRAICGLIRYVVNHTRTIKDLLRTQMKSRAA